MKIKIGLLNLFFFLSFISCVWAAEVVEIAGIKIPVIEGAVVSGWIENPAANVETVSYAVGKPLPEVVKFYELFFANNDFILFGGRESGSFNASVKKDQAMFTLRIYVSGSQTILQFIW